MSERKKERFNKGDIFIGIMNTIIEIRCRDLEDNMLKIKNIFFKFFPKKP